MFALPSVVNALARACATRATLPAVGHAPERSEGNPGNAIHEEQHAADSAAAVSKGAAPAPPDGGHAQAKVLAHGHHEHGNVPDRALEFAGGKGSTDGAPLGWSVEEAAALATVCAPPARASLVRMRQ